MRVVAIAALLLIGSVATAQTVSLTQIGDTCPAREPVLEALGRLHPGVRIVEDDSQAALAVTIADLGDRFTVVASRHKTFEDPARDCDERARTAALVVALALDDLAPPPPAASPVPSPPVPSPPVPLAPPPQNLLPYAVIDRPLVLPRGRAEVTEELTFAAFPASQGTPYGLLSGFDNVLSADVGLGHRVQLGLLVAIPYSRNTNDVTVLPRITVALHRDVALRLEAGFERAQNTDDGVHVTEANGAFLAATLVTRVRVRSWLTVSFGDTGPRTELPLQVGPLTNLLSVLTSQALLTMRVSPNAAFAAAINLPLALLFQPHPKVAVRIGTGLRFRFDGSGFNDLAFGFPFNFDVIVTPHPRFDIGALFAMPLEIASPVFFTSALFVRFRY